MPQKVTPKTLAADDRAIKGLNLRRLGKSYQQISEHPWPDGPNGMLYGGDRHNCRRALVAARGEAIREPAQEVIDMEIERLDEMFAGLALKGAFKGNVPAVNAALNLMARRAKLLGIDAPTEINQRGGGNVQLVVDGTAVRVGMDVATMEVTETDD